VGIKFMTGLDPGYPQRGIMKPQMGFTPVAGKEKLGMGKRKKRRTRWELD